MSTVRLRWRPSTALLTLATVGLVGVVLAAAFRSGDGLALVAPELVWLAYYGRPRLPQSAQVDVDCWPRRCQENSQVTAHLAVTATPSLLLHACCLAPRGRLEGTTTDGDTHRWVWEVEPTRWGRMHLCRGRVRLTSRGGLWASRLQVTWPEVEVLPAAIPLHQTVRARVRDWPGSRASRAGGPGTEPIGVTKYVPGLPVRHVNWRQTMRHRALHLNSFAAERAQDLVIVVDATVAAGPPGANTIDRAVRAAAAFAASHIDDGDRVGLVTIAPAMDWVSPGLGQKHLVRLLQVLIRVGERDSVVPPNLDRIPRAAVPQGSLVVLLSPLLSEESVGIAGDLRRRGHPVLLVDVLAGEPKPQGDPRSAQTTLRLWRLERLATQLALQDRGVRVLAWPPSTDLDAVLAGEISGRARVYHVEAMA